MNGYFSDVFRRHACGAWAVRVSSDSWLSKTKLVQLPDSISMELEAIYLDTLHLLKEKDTEPKSDLT